MRVDVTGRGMPQPNAGGQSGFCGDWDNLFVALEGGWGSGKTWAGARKLLTLHIHNSFTADGQPTGVSSAAIAPTYTNARDFVIPALLEAAEESGLIAMFKSSQMNIEFARLPPIIVRTAEHPERITGWQVGAAWGDEPARWKSDKHDALNDPLVQLTGRVRHPSAQYLQLMFTYTNEGDHTRIFDEFNSGKPGHSLYRSGTSENPMMAEFCVSQRRLLSEDLARQYLDGHAVSIRGGRVYTGFKAEDHVDDSLEIVKGAPLQLALDFNISPGMHAIVGQYSESADVFTAVHEIYDNRLDVQGLVRRFGNLVDDLGGWQWPDRLHVFGDATGSAEWAGVGRSCYDILCEGLTGIEVPYRLRVPKANPPVVDRINAFNVALKDTAGGIHWKCHPRCERLIEDMRSLKRDKDGAMDKTERKLSHASDAEGYRIHFLRPARRIENPKRGKFNV